LQALPKPVGILSCADFHGRNLLEACRTVGLRVPHDIAVIGVDNDELDCEIAIPSLTSIAQSPRRIGHEAARLLDRAIRPDRFGSRSRAVVVPARTVIPPLGVVPRRSTDTFAAVDPAISRVIVALRDRVDAGLSLDDLAAIAELSTWQLRRRFQSVIGHSIRDHMILTRVAEAERLISTTDLPLKVVARRSGFRSVTYMTTMFRRRYGDPPARYRRLGQGTQNSVVTGAAVKTERRCRES
jgi:LacI family transcriptional regulator